jgi:hypothetical protein
MARLPIKPASPNPRVRVNEDNTVAVYGDLQYMYNYALNNLDSCAFYELDIDQSTVVNITTRKGIIEINNMDAIPFPTPGCGSAVYITLTSPTLPINDPHKIYLQLTPYYNPVMGDNVVPHIVAHGAINGSVVAIYNVSNQTAGANQWEGLFYIYYEIKSLV